jgi:spermidine synthase
MIAHLPACALARAPRRALVVGGGDGGVLRELARHASLEEIHIAEIDGMVIDVSKKHFPGMAAGFADPRVSVHVCDGIKFVEEAAPGAYDLIVVDSSDPVGPAEVLFQRPFFEFMHRALAPGGVVCTQAESLWYHMGIIKELAAMCAGVFGAEGSVQYAFTTIPTYPSGQIGFMICTKGGGEGGPRADPREARRPPPAAPADAPLKYYSAEVHRAAFTLPAFARDALKGSLSF